jgi:hypothetical protein
MTWAGRTLVAIAVFVGLGGCGLHYWGKAGSSQDDFNRDSAACSKEASPQYGVFIKDNYRGCLRARGWSRAQHHEPPPGWYRGIE